MRHLSLLNQKLPERAWACRGVFCFDEDLGRASGDSLRLMGRES